MKKVSFLILLFMTGFITTGCMKSVMRFNADGSGTMEIGFNMSIQSLQDASMMSDDAPSDELNDISDLMSGEPMLDDKTGISVSAEERLENGSMWTYIIMDIPTIEAWQYLSSSAENLFPEDNGDTPADPSTLAVIPDVTLEGDTIRVELTVPSTVDQNANEDDPFGMASIMGAFIQVSYEIEMPGTLIEHNGQIDTLTGNPVWIIDLTSSDDLEISVESTLE